LSQSTIDRTFSTKNGITVKLGNKEAFSLYGGDVLPTIFDKHDKVAISSLYVHTNGEMYQKTSSRTWRMFQTDPTSKQSSDDLINARKRLLEYTLNRTNDFYFSVLIKTVNITFHSDDQFRTRLSLLYNMSQTSPTSKHKVLCENPVNNEQSFMTFDGDEIFAIATVEHNVRNSLITEYESTYTNLSTMKDFELRNIHNGSQ